MTSSRLVRSLDARLYPELLDRWDETRFRAAVLRYVNEGSVCLDFGAGRGNVAEMNFRGVAARVAGADVDRAVLGNPNLDEAAVIGADGKLPFPAGIFDVIFSDNVMEHLDDPLTVFRELRRVLKPGGVLLAKTPNAQHYMPLFSRLTPFWFHRWFNALRGQKVHDTFPTRYRCNTRRRVRDLAARTGFEVLTMEMWEGRPEYLRVSSITYVIGWMYERIVNSTDRLQDFRIVLMFVLKKPADDV